MRTIFFSILLLTIYALHAAADSDFAVTPLQTVEYYLNDINALHVELVRRVRREKEANDLLGECLLASKDRKLYFERSLWGSCPWQQKQNVSLFSEYTMCLLIRPFDSSDVARFAQISDRMTNEESEIVFEEFRSANNCMEGLWQAVLR